mmetsp:Transcript_27715/g.63026  ORF Transcript_27715/g.63026 Transcript_27715/m.63026 type:complete len:224 (-) Transcript_27715:107-778(-)
MAMPLLAPVYLLLLTGASAGRSGTVGRGSSTAPSFSEEAAEVGNMMEAVRQRTEGGKAPAAARILSTQSVPLADRFPDLDAELLSRADQIGRELPGQAIGDTVHSVKRAALAAETTKPSRSRAARFFAVHGMSEVGHLLGDELSATDTAEALRGAAHANHMLAEAAGPSTNLARRGARAASTMPATSTSTGELDLELAEEEDAKAEKERWGAVDRLRHRARPM